MSGPLTGIRIVELAGIGPGPFCGMMLADHGADVVRVDRLSAGSLPLPQITGRGRRSIAIDLKRREGVEIVLELVASADGLIEGFRPGVAERLGVGPDVCLQRNPRLVYGRMTGWGQEGPLAATAGHDIDYIALSGALHAIGRDRPVPPLNLVGDYGGGGMLLAFGMVAALLAAARTGEGQVVDAAMVDGAALLMTPIYELFAAGFWRDERSANLLDGGAPFYDVYETADGEYMAVGALEPQFYAELLQRLGLAEADLPAQLDVSGWPTARERLAAVFRSKTRREWEQVFAESDACVAPVLGLAEAPEHPHNQARQTFIEVGGVRQPGTAPRFSRADRGVPTPAAEPGSHTEVILGELGYEPERISDLRAQGVVA